MIRKLLLSLSLLVFASASFAQSARIKDLARLRGDRSNNLIGYGLVIGLNGTGDSAASLSTNKAVSNLLNRIGMSVEGQLATSASAAVIITADLPAFARVGDKIDVKLSVIGDAKSLAGGTLIMTPLSAGDGEVYAVASGGIVIGQATGAGPRVLTVATIPDGAHIEKDFLPSLVQNQAIDYNLMNADFTTAQRIAVSINRFFRSEIATAVDAARVKVAVPQERWGSLTGFISEIEALEVQADQKAVVIVNERTGTVVMGGDVKVADVAITHGGLSIQVGAGKQAKSEAVMPLEGTTISDLVKSLNQMGVKPEDLISILQSIHAAGALKAEIRFM